MKKLIALAIACAVTLPVYAKDKDKPTQGGKSAQASAGTKAQNNVDGRSAKSKGETSRATPAEPAKK